MIILCGSWGKNPPTGLRIGYLIPCTDESDDVPYKNCMNWRDHPFQAHPYTANVVWLCILIPLYPYYSTVIGYTTIFRLLTPV